MPQVTRNTKPRPKVNRAAKPAKAGSALSRVTGIDFSSDDGIKVNVYGRSGTGKTTFWATFPKPILALVCSGGNRPGELRSINTPEYRRTIKSLHVESSADIYEVVDHQQQTGEYATVVLDHLTSFQDLVLAEILGVDQVPEQKSWGFASREQYGACTRDCKQVLRALLNLGCNVVVVAQERNFNEDTDNGFLLPSVASAVSPSLAGWLNPAVDYIGRTIIRQKTEQRKVKVAGKVKTREVVTDGVEYCLHVGPSPVYMTKFRMPKGIPLPDVIVDPTYDKMLKLIQAG